MRKIEQETLRKRQAENVIHQMEQEEKELITRLRRTQQLQEKVRFIVLMLYEAVCFIFT